MTRDLAQPKRAEKLGLSLGAGGARGWCHIGILRALDEIGVVPDRVAGCSMGALVGAAWAADRLDALEDWAMSLTAATLWRTLDVRLRDGGLLKGEYLRELFAEIDLPERIEDLNRPFLAVAADMQTGREIWMQEGSLFDAVRASISIPGLFRPHYVQGRYLLDGGVVNPVPNSACRAIGAEHIIAVNPNAKSGLHWTPEVKNTLFDDGAGWVSLLPNMVQAPVRKVLSPEKPKGPDMVTVLSVSIDIMTAYIALTRSAADPADVMLDADLAEMSILELYRAEDAIAEGRRMVQAQRDALQRLGADGTH